MASPRLRRLAQRSITSRKTRSTNSLERTSCTVPLRPAEEAHQRYHERPFALVVTLRPFARVQQYCAERVHPSPSDLMTLPFQFVSTRASVFFFCLVLFLFDHLYRMHIHHDHLDTASKKKKKSSKTWARRSPWRKQSQHSQIKACMHRRSSRIYEEAFGDNSA